MILKKLKFFKWKLIKNLSIILQEYIFIILIGAYFEKI